MKKYRLVIFAILPLVLLVLYWQFGRQHFSNDPGKLARQSINGSNLISLEQLQSVSGSKLIVRLDSCKTLTGISNITVMAIPASDILSGNNLRLIKNHSGPVILSSCDRGLSARIWMLLSQMDISNLYILDNT